MRYFALLLLLALPARAVELTLFTNSVSLPEGTTIQVPLTGSNNIAGPLTYKIDSISWRAVKGAFAPATNRTLILNITGVDSNNAPFAGDLVFQLCDDLTPLTTARIAELVTSNYYNGRTFHRVIQNFVAQAGNTNGTTGVTFEDEFALPLIFNGFAQLAMANSGRDSNDSQFFITDVDLSAGNASNLPPRHLDYKHTIFGQMTRGFDTLAALMTTPTTNGGGFADFPISSNIIQSATIISNSPDAVLRLTSLVGFTGDVTVAVSAANANRETSQQTLLVHVVANTANDPPFLSPIPASFVVTQAKIGRAHV